MTPAISLATAPSAVVTSSVAASLPKAQPARAQPAANTNADSFHLTDAEQVDQLYAHGQTVPEIAYGMNLSVQAVNQYLNISGSK